MNRIHIPFSFAGSSVVFSRASFGGLCFSASGPCAAIRINDANGDASGGYLPF